MATRLQCCEGHLGHVSSSRITRSRYGHILHLTRWDPVLRGGCLSLPSTSGDGAHTPADTWHRPRGGR